MCGIIGIVSDKPVASRLLEGLQRLAYRGYDSTGIATLSGERIERRRAVGKLINLVEQLRSRPIDGTVGIGHTRWASHGAPSEANAHPHMNEHVALVHNGIVENFCALRRDLDAKGHVFSSQTDTETLVHLLTDFLQQGCNPHQATMKALQRVEGAFSLAVLFRKDPGLLIGSCRGSPLAIGYGEGETYLGSDALALGHLTERIAYLEEGDIALLRRDSVEVIESSGHPAERRIHLTELSGALAGKGNYRHFMEKEIHEQPTVVGDSLNALIDDERRAVALPDLSVDLNKIDRVTLIGCGTSYYAANIAKYWIEALARLPVELDIASEYRYRESPVSRTGLSVFISQSGETIDTLAALRYAKSQGSATLGVVNVPTSAIARQADAALLTMAGPEIGVASTKAFTTQLSTLLCLAIALASARRAIDADRQARIVAALMEIPARMAEVLIRMPSQLKPAVELVAEARDAVYLGRGTNFPIAMEGALKLKEISYIHAEGYAAGEMKHGPIALIDESVPVIGVAPSDRWFDKMASNLEEVAARRGLVVAFTDKAGAARLAPIAHHIVEMPDVDELVAPLLYSLPIQLLAYRVAVRKGTDVDQPRNLAKSVTVE